MRKFMCGMGKLLMCEFSGAHSLHKHTVDPEIFCIAVFFGHGNYNAL